MVRIAVCSIIMYICNQYVHSKFIAERVVLQAIAENGLSAKVIRVVEDEEYNSAMESAGNDPQKAKTLSSLLAYKDAAHGKKAASVPVVNAYTTQVLYRLGFKWSPTTWDYVDQMLGAISGLGFFD